MSSLLASLADVDPLLIGTALIVIVLTGSKIPYILARFQAAASLRQAKDEAKTGPVVGRVSELSYYPVKSLRAVSPKTVSIGERGLENDRAYMLVYPIPLPVYKTSFAPTDSTHRFLSQRQCPILATISVHLDSDSLVVNYGGDKKSAGKKQITIPAQAPADAKQIRAGVWGDQVLCDDMGDAAAAFFQSIVGLETNSAIGDEGTEGDASASSLYKGVRLVAQSNQDDRRASSEFTPLHAKTWWTNSTPQVQLSDGFPILIACQASLDELNRRLQKNGDAPISMKQFRANIVIDGDMTPFAEDKWKMISIGNQLFSVVKACPRCKQSCTNQVTGEVSTQPLAVMRSFRALNADSKEDVFFAQNALPVGERTSIAVGDVVRVLSTGDPVYK